MTTLTYEDLMDIREALVARQDARNALLRKVDAMIEETGPYRSLDTMRPNAETLAAMEEAKNWRSLPAYATVREALAAVGDDED